MERNVENIKKGIITLIFALIGQALCWITIIVSFAVTTQYNALIIHAILAPVFFCIISLIYFKKFNYTTPIITAILFISVVVLLDFFVVALLIEQSLDMFRSPIGTWIPFTSIFLATLLTGIYVNQDKYN